MILNDIKYQRVWCHVNKEKIPCACCRHLKAVDSHVNNNIQHAYSIYNAGELMVLKDKVDSLAKENLELKLKLMESQKRKEVDDLIRDYMWADITELKRKMEILERRTNTNFESNLFK